MWISLFWVFGSENQCFAPDETIQPRVSSRQYSAENIQPKYSAKSIQSKVLSQNYSAESIQPKVFSRKYSAEYIQPKVFSRKYLAESIKMDLRLFKNRVWNSDRIVLIFAMVSPNCLPIELESWYFYSGEFTYQGIDCKNFSPLALMKNGFPGTNFWDFFLIFKNLRITWILEISNIYSLTKSDYDPVVMFKILQWAIYISKSPL